MSTTVTTNAPAATPAQPGGGFDASVSGLNASAPQVDAPLRQQHLRVSAKTTAESDGAGGTAMPGLPLPLVPCDDPGALAMMVMSVQMRLNNVQALGAKQQVEIAGDQRARRNEKILADTQEAQKRSDAIAKKQSPVVKWLTKVAALVGAVIAVASLSAMTIASGGAASPLLGLAILGLVAATMDMASAISQQAGGPPLNLTQGLELGFSKLMVKFGMSEDKAMQTAKLLTGVVVAATMVGVLIAPDAIGDGIAGLSQLAFHASDAQAAMISGVITAAVSIAISVVMIVAGNTSGTFAAGAKVTELFASVCRWSGNIGQFVSAGNSIAQGGVGISIGVDQRAADLSNADIVDQRAEIVESKQLADRALDDMRKLFESSNNIWKIAAAIVQRTGETQSKLTTMV